MYYSRPIIPLLIAFIIGISAGSRFPGHTWQIAISCCCVAGILCFHRIRQHPIKFSPLVLFITLGYLSVQPWLHPLLSENHIIHHVDTHRWNITGVVDSDPIERDHRSRFILRVDHLQKDQKSLSVSGRIRVTVVGGGLLIRRGDTVAFKSRIRSIRNFNNPGGFDYQRFMAFQGVRGSAYPLGDQLEIISQHRGNSLSKHLTDIRRRVSVLIDGRVQGPQNSVLKALIIGNRGEIDKSVRQAFNKAGVGHLLAISGLHVGIVATAAFFLFNRLLSLIGPVLWRAWGRKGAAILTLIPVVAYGLIAGMSASTQRAVIMVAVFLTTYIFGREHDPLNTLAAAAMLILFVNPPALFSVSFQLSFTAALAIIYGLSRMKSMGWLNSIEAGRENRLRQVGRRLFLFFSVSFLAVMGTLPAVTYYFNQISLIGLLTNFVAIPLIGFLVVPMGLFALTVYPLSHLIGGASLSICGWLLGLSMDIISVFAELPFAAVKTVTPSALEIGCFYVLAWALLNMRQDQVARPGERSKVDETAQDFVLAAPAGVFSVIQVNVGRQGQRLAAMISRMTNRRNIAVIALFLATIVGMADIGYWLYARFWHPDLRVTAIDVGQGTATLLEIPGGRTLLIDGGGFSDNAVFDMGERVIAPILWHRKIKTVDTIILSHANSDHLNGLLYIAEHFNVENIWTNSEPRNTLGYHRLLKVARSAGIHMPHFTSLAREHLFNGVQLSILYPPQDFFERRHTEKWRNTNNNSLVVKVSYGSTSFLFPGDIQRHAEKELVYLNGENLKGTVLMAPHHGSKSSSSSIFLDKIQPGVVVFSCGWKNRFGFPHASVMDRYHHYHSQIYRTDLNGSIYICTDGENLTVQSYIHSN